MRATPVNPEPDQWLSGQPRLPARREAYCGGVTPPTNYSHLPADSFLMMSRSHRPFVWSVSAASAWPRQCLVTPRCPPPPCPPSSAGSSRMCIFTVPVALTSRCCTACFPRPKSPSSWAPRSTWARAWPMRADWGDRNASASTSSLPWSCSHRLRICYSRGESGTNDEVASFFCEITWDI